MYLKLILSIVLSFCITVNAKLMVFISNKAFISITTILNVLVTAIQMSGEEASLMTSAVMVSYATYLCFTAVSKNPNGQCNPKLGDEDVLGCVLGVGFALMSLAWAGWSLTAANKISGER